MKAVCVCVCACEFLHACVCGSAGTTLCTQQRLAAPYKGKPPQHSEELLCKICLILCIFQTFVHSFRLENIYLPFLEAELKPANESTGQQEKEETFDHHHNYSHDPHFVCMFAGVSQVLKCHSFDLLVLISIIKMSSNTPKIFSFCQRWQLN